MEWIGVFLAERGHADLANFAFMEKRLWQNKTPERYVV
jgi:hypothetical protein